MSLLNEPIIEKNNIINDLDNFKDNYIKTYILEQLIKYDCIKFHNYKMRDLILTYLKKHYKLSHNDIIIYYGRNSPVVSNDRYNRIYIKCIFSDISKHFDYSIDFNFRY